MKDAVFSEPASFDVSVKQHYVSTCGNQHTGGIQSRRASANYCNKVFRTTLVDRQGSFSGLGN